jgi:heme exporter protein C
MKNWWKVVSVVLLAYALYAGLTVPVGPGIAGVDKQKVAINPTIHTTFDLAIEGYNTNFIAGDFYSVWLKKDSFYICGKAKALQANSLSATFTVEGLLPERYNSQAFTLVVLGAKDGLFLSPSQVALTTSGDSLKQMTTCKGPKEVTKSTYFSFPYRNILYESIRNLNYHVPMWFAMIALLFVSFVYSIMFLNKLNPIYDIKASQLADVGILFGLLGITTGAFWARFTWGVFWSPDPKLNGAAIGVLIYLAYNILRSTINDPSKTGRLAAVYNIMAFPIFIVLIIILPKVADFSLHPGSGDSVGFKDYDLDSNLRMIFYPAVLGWVLLGFWIAQLRTRIFLIKHKHDND